MHDHLGCTACESRVWDAPTRAEALRVCGDGLGHDLHRHLAHQSVLSMTQHSHKGPQRLVLQRIQSLSEGFVMVSWKADCSSAEGTLLATFRLQPVGFTMHSMRL